MFTFVVECICKCRTWEHTIVTQSYILKLPTSAQNYNAVTPPIGNHGESGRQPQSDTVSFFHLNIARFSEEQSCNREEINFIGQRMFGFRIGAEDDENVDVHVDDDGWVWKMDMNNPKNIHECLMDL